MCAGHGDYAHNQVIFVEGRTVTWDWDVYDIADPTRDVASFIVTLEKLALKSRGSVRALDDAAEVFLKTYLDLRGHSPVAAHLPFYKAAYCLWEAHWEAKTKRKLGWGERAETMLDEGLHTLDG
jgi:aminoglycoside phosphotransferase (APT) family kinase protein